ncbi:hypothetical protein ACXYUI_28245, partial [Klebsiella pneumoniae]
PIYYTLQTKDSVQRSGIVQVDGNGLIEIGGNSFYEDGEIIFSLLDTCANCTIELYNLTGNKSDINYFKSIFTQVDTAFKIDNKQITELEF